jgi:hypothetical protein
MNQIECRASDPRVLEMLGRHPRVRSVEPSEHQGIRFNDGEWAREVRVGDPTVEQFGLLELMDNNPLLCADSVSVPSPAGTLALLALGPAAIAGLLLERPVLVLSFPASESEVGDALQSVGWSEGADLHIEALELGDVLVASAIAVVSTPTDLSELEEVYGERYDRSFFVRRVEESQWARDSVSGTPVAGYRISVAPDTGTSLLTVRVMAARSGKCGAAQLVHTMNVMCGFEETLGIA